MYLPYINAQVIDSDSQMETVVQFGLFTPMTQFLPMKITPIWSCMACMALYISYMSPPKPHEDETTSQTQCAVSCPPVVILLYLFWRNIIIGLIQAAAANLLFFLLSWVKKRLVVIVFPSLFLSLSPQPYSFSHWFIRVVEDQYEMLGLEWGLIQAVWHKWQIFTLVLRISWLMRIGWLWNACTCTTFDKETVDCCIEVCRRRRREW